MINNVIMQNNIKSYNKSIICFDTRVSDVSHGVLSLPSRVRSHPEKSSGTFVALTGTPIIIQPSMTCPFLLRSLRCYISNLFCGTILRV